MSKKVTVQFIKSKFNTNSVSPIVYLHWGRDDVDSWIKELKELMFDRLEDNQYACARFIGICHEHLDGNTSLGVYNADDIEADVVVDCADFSYYIDERFTV